jgi:hypothetical protein
MRIRAYLSDSYLSASYYSALTIHYKHTLTVPVVHLITLHGQAYSRDGSYKSDRNHNAGLKF